MANEHLEVQIGADISEITKALKQVQTKLKQTAKTTDQLGERMKGAGAKMQSIGGSLTASITAPLLGLGVVAVSSASKIETLQTSLKTAFAGNETASKSAFDQITKFATSTPYQVNEVADAFIKLKNYGLDPSEKALTSYGNTASAMGKSLDQMIEAVADAGTGEFERLKEFGIKSSKQGANVVFTFKGMKTKVGNNSKEIEAYLQKLGNVDFAGGMEAQSKTFAGRMSTLKDSVSSAMAGFGVIIIEYLNPFIKGISNLAKKFKELSPATKKIIVIVGGLVAIIPPLLVGLGFLATTIIPALVTGLGLLTLPVLGIVAGLIAVGVVIYKNWAPIKKLLVSFANYFIDLYNESMAFRVVIESIKLSFLNQWTVIKFVFNAIWNIIKTVAKNIVTVFSSVGKVIKGALTFDYDMLQEGFNGFENGFVDNVKEMGETFKDDFAEASKEVAENTTNALNNIQQKAKIVLTEENVDTTGVVKAVEKAVNTTPKTRAKVTAIHVEKAGLETSIFDTEPMKLVGDHMTQAEKDQQSALIDMAWNLHEFNESASDIINNGINRTFNNMVDSIAGALGRGGNWAKAGAKSLLEGLGRICMDLGKMALKIGLGIKAIKMSLSNLNPVLALGAGVALIALGTMFSKGASKLGSSGSSGTGGGGGGGGSQPSNYTPQDTGRRGGNVSYSSSDSPLNNVIFEIQGTKLVGVISNTLNRNKSLAGTLKLQ